MRTALSPTLSGRMLRRLRIENLVLIRKAELSFAPGLNAVTGETGAGKTIFAQAIGLLLGAKADASAVGAEGAEAYVEAELDVPDGFFDEDELAALADLRPVDEAGLVIARRVFGDGRTRAYAWGRAVAREDVAAAAERLIAMSGQFEQRRLARPAFQLEVLDAFCGAEQLERRREARFAWRELGAARRRYDELTRDADAVALRLAELQALVEATEGMKRGDEQELLSRRERLRHVEELAAAANAALSAIAPEEGEGASSLTALAERALAPLERIAPELGTTAEELRDLSVRLHEVGSDLHRFVATLDAEPGALEEVEERLQEIADVKRRFAAGSYDELLERAAGAESELGDSSGGDPVVAAREAVERAEARMNELADELRTTRAVMAGDLGQVVSDELASLGMGEGEFLAELSEREVNASGADEATFLIRPNPGLPFVPIADTASGGELSRIALALAAVAGGETLVFDEIDAGIGGVTAHAVASTLQRLAERAQVLTITHLPQIASVADSHFRVEKVPGDPTHTSIEELDDLLRREEIERMAGGAEFIATITESA
jgi:DNA repair protein RecN (Recombination protein N)